MVNFVSKPKKNLQKTPKLTFCNKTHQLQVIQDENFTLRPVLNFLHLHMTGPDPLFNLGPNSFIVITKVNHSS